MATIKGKNSVSDYLIYTLMILASFITLYPCIYVFSCSISNPLYVVQKTVWFLPKGFSLEAYKLVFQNRDIWNSYYNTIWYTVVGTFINVLLTILGAYPLSRRRFFMRSALTFMVTFTMFFSGGLIPSFILINKLGLYNTRWALILPGAVGAFNLIITKTFFQSIPDSLEESAQIDGANDFVTLFRIIVPVSMPVVAVVILFYSVAHWNSYFDAMLYLPDHRLQPLQIYLMKVLVQMSEEIAGQIDTGLHRSMVVEQIKYCVIVITILPILAVYPFLQKYFVKGMMIGAIKA